ncbi:hypothetical protein C0431_05540 [bacterium]|nr:hypothetical protein [bacterium]
MHIITKVVLGDNSWLSLFWLFDEGSEFAVGHGLLVAGEFAEDRPDGLGDLGVGYGGDTAGFWHWFRLGNSFCHSTPPGSFGTTLPILGEGSC